MFREMFPQLIHEIVATLNGFSFVPRLSLCSASLALACCRFQVVVPCYGDIQELRDLIKFPSISILDAALWRATTFTMIMSLGLCSGNKLW
ncbi:hypothetical protein WN944_006081 [Citrus x changshan-huyou]|uniref:Uncharacterized protein n=1 Tax=Citrus x changshan-huyou TaxID=2935761 RepID=A0AAP0MKE4_9ROSI